MPEILQNTGARLWSLVDDFEVLRTTAFEELTGIGGKSNIRLIDEAIGNINSALDGYYLLYENDRLYIIPIDDGYKLALDFKVSIFIYDYWWKILVIR